MLRIAIAGCGVMGRRHVKGLAKLIGVNRQRFELVAACDPVEASANALADLAAELLGQRPRIYPDIAAMMRDIEVDALDVTTAPDLHKSIALEAFAAGLHVLMEKPIALTVRQGREVIAAGRSANRVLSVAENYRRDPINRLAKALIDAGALGRPFLAVQTQAGWGESVIITPWRHLRDHCGIAIDMGVHYADILEYLLGPIDTVAGLGGVVDRERIGTDGSRYPADAEDLTVGIGQYASGALANMVLNLAGRGEDTFSRVVYGTTGSLTIPGDRTGKPLHLAIRRNGSNVVVSDEELLSLVPDFHLDPTTADLFGGERLMSYDLSWADIDANLLAIEFDDLADAVERGVEPEVTGEQGLRSLAISYGFLESQQLQRFVHTEHLLQSLDSPYQDAIDGGR